ncbi:transaldolase [Sulfurifustis variabilis]|uniref:Transaldolase n=1 Tax=Sulfurifustis variabilis TaxID=1675686 RepID=A0A1B4V6W7_9GAMM|nr:transaldolase [Sulfurifustis variabilis]BAU49289.1 transaldolase [Sulfurifustis variabilis]
MDANPLRALHELGQSVWLDDIRRAWLDDGTLARLIADDGVAGVTSNPAIFEKAISGGGEYDGAIAELTRLGKTPGTVYETLAIDDVRRAADLLRPAWDATNGADGFVSLEVSPHFADYADATVREAKRLWAAFDRPNAMIKVPGTHAGLTAVRALLRDGVNVNVTLLFGLSRYREVAESFLAGLEARLADGRPVDRVASVASFFLSRIDTLVDRKLDEIGTAPARALRGRAAIASARLAYRHYRGWTAGERWRRLAAAGARAQRLLWASTSTKDPAYADTKYVEALIGPETINTMPLGTLTAYRDHGRPAPRLEEDLQGALDLPDDLAGLGINLDRTAEQLERDGVQKFIEPFDALHAALARRQRELRS